MERLQHFIERARNEMIDGFLSETSKTLPVDSLIVSFLGPKPSSSDEERLLSKEHVHMFVEMPPQDRAVSDFVRRVKGRSSHRVQMEFPELRKRYWGRHFWARGYFCTTSGNITDEAILQYLKYHEPTGVSR